MKFELWQQGIVDRPLMKLDASSEEEAWRMVKRAGIRNRSKLFELVEIE